MLYAILIVVVIIVVYYSYKKGKDNCVPNREMPKIVDGAKDGFHTRDLIKRGVYKAETMLDYEQDCENCDRDLAYEKNPYGAEDANYQDWVMAQGVDQAQIENHKTFVNERLAQGGLVSHPFSPDSHDSYNPVDWIGLRRPQQVSIDEKTARSLPDMDYSLLENCNSLRWGCK